ncbi:MAG: acetate--CoA ligase family protein [Candidatus Omnitrophica bacterium]|nr:acetate--CoA ligase family protein [Candidatus Omnitrophota bacterium]
MSDSCCGCSGDSKSNKNSKNLEGFFNPKSVAVIGASANPAKIGFQILNNIVVGGYAGEVYPINPNDAEILGKKAYKTVGDVAGKIDLAIITIPAKFVIASLEECAKKGIKNVAIITSGFGEVGNHKDEDRLKQIADENGIAFIGPNILGLLYMPSKLNASFGPSDVLPGKIAFISQSGALAIALMGWTAKEKIGLSALVSLGNKADIGEKELIEYFNNDKNVDVNLIYMEGLTDGRKFLQTKVEKPVIVLKVGRSARGAKAAASHTGSLAGSDGVFNAAFKQLGMLRASSFTEAFGWARALSLPMPKGDETIVITNGGGIGVATTDACEDAGIKLMEDTAWTEGKFRCTMPDFGSTKNPIDITGGSGVQGYRDASRIAFTEDRVNNVIVLYCETAVTDPVEVAKAVYDEWEKSGKKKPVTVTMVGGQRSSDGIAYLNERHIPAYDNVEEAVSGLKVLYTWKRIKEQKKDNPSVEKAPQQAIDLINKVKAEGRTVMLEHEARQVMELCGVPTPPWGFAVSEDDAVKQANSKNLYPIAMKIASVDIIHKTDMGGVVLNIRDEQDLRAKYRAMMEHLKKVAPTAKLDGVNLIKMVKGIECIVGLSQDPQFGPIIMFGLGGVFVEALKDVSFRVVPFGPVEAERMIGEIKAKKILDGFRGMKAHKESLIGTMCAIQKLAPYVKEIDVNPIMTSAEGSYAVDARIIL